MTIPLGEPMTENATATISLDEQTARELGTATPGRLGLRSLRKIYGDDRNGVPAVKDIDLDIHPGEFITLLGPSGCGKTTTLRMVAGFETPTAGELRLDDAVINRVPPQQPADGHGVPDLRALPAPERRREHGLRPEAEEAARQAGPRRGRDRPDLA